MTPRLSASMLCFLIEETTRELASRVLLCTVAAEMGFSTAIIPQWSIWKRFERLVPGVVVFKGKNAVQTQHMLKARDARHLVAALEEEALGITLDIEIQRLFDPRTARACDLILAQGENVRDVIIARDQELADRIVVTGNPRIDLLRPPFTTEIMARGEEIKRTHGDYVLINSNIGSVNPRIEDVYSVFNACIQVGLVRADHPEDRENFILWSEWERGNLALLTEVIGAYLNHPEYPPLIIRPHPSENISKWRHAYKDEDRVSIILDGDHLPWIAGARLLIHTGCTTGTEAALLGAPVLSLKGGESKWHPVSTSNHVNQTASDTEQAMTMIDQHLSGNGILTSLTPKQRRELERNVLPSPKDLAARRVILALHDLVLKNGLAGGQPGEARAPWDMDFQFSDAKIAPDSFTVDAITKLATGFAESLGHAEPPVISSPNVGMVAVSPGS